MKKTLTILFIFSLFCLPVFSYAQQEQQGIHEPGTGLDNPTVQGNQNMNGSDSLQQGTDNDNQNGIHEPGTGMESEEQGQADEEQQNQRAIVRRSRVANAVQEMERIATRNEGIGEQLRVIAQNQNQKQEEAENVLSKAQERGSFARFFVGPNYSQLKNVEEKLQNFDQNLSELKELRQQMEIQADKELLDEQIEVMEQVIQEMENDVAEDKKGFALFGWLSKLIVK